MFQAATKRSTTIVFGTLSWVAHMHFSTNAPGVSEKRLNRWKYQKVSVRNVPVLWSEAVYSTAVLLVSAFFVG
jgi:hypothetical protein